MSVKESYYLACLYGENVFAYINENDPSMAIILGSSRFGCDIFTGVSTSCSDFLVLEKVSREEVLRYLLSQKNNS
jgi:hypothetical protein